MFNTFLNTITQFFTLENISFMLGLIGTIGTIATGISNYLHSRKSLEMKIEKICKFGNHIIAYFTILNKSRLPISISCISVKMGNKLYSGYHVPQPWIHISSIRDKDCIASHDCFPTSFPITIGELAGASCYILFDIPPALQEKLETHLICVISSNRGRQFQMQLKFDQWSNWTCTI